MISAGQVMQTGRVPGNAWPQPPGGWPPGVWRVPYMLSAGPGSDTPPLWSSDLWDDRAATAVVQDPEPLDLMLYNKTADPYSAHVAVWMAPGEILHLCHEIGVPAIWPPVMFAARPRYATLIGFKRVAVFLRSRRPRRGAGWLITARSRSDWIPYCPR